MTRWPGQSILRRPARSSAIGVEIDGGHIRAAQLLESGSRCRLAGALTLGMQSQNEPGATGRDAAGEGGTPPVRMLQPGDVRRLAGALDRQGFCGNRIHLALPSDMQLSGVMELPPCDSGAPLDQLTRMELSRMHRCAPESIEIGWWPLPARRRGASEGIDVMAAACSLEHAHGLLNLFAAEGLQIHALDVSSWSLCRAAVKALKASNGPAVVINLGWEAATIVLVHEGVVVYERTAPEAAIISLYRALAEQLAITPEQIQLLLHEWIDSEQATNHDTRPTWPVQAREVIDAHFEPLMREVGVSCSYVGQRHSVAEFEQALIAGAGANLPNIAQKISDALHLPASAVQPAQIVECPSRMSQGARSPASDSALIVAIGMAMHPGN